MKTRQKKLKTFRNLFKKAENKEQEDEEQESRRSREEELGSILEGRLFGKGGGLEQPFMSPAGEEV